MMSKRQFAEMVVDDFCRENNVDREKVSGHIYASSGLAVALEFLGELSKEEQEYSIKRGGTAFHYYDREKNEVVILSVREILNMLPEEEN